MSTCTSGNVWLLDQIYHTPGSMIEFSMSDPDPALGRGGDTIRKYRIWVNMAASQCGDTHSLNLFFVIPYDAVFGFLSFFFFFITSLKKKKKIKNLSLEKCPPPTSTWICVSHIYQITKVAAWQDTSFEHKIKPRNMDPNYPRYSWSPPHQLTAAILKPHSLVKLLWLL